MNKISKNIICDKALYHTCKMLLYKLIVFLKFLRIQTIISLKVRFKNISVYSYFLYNTIFNS